MTDKEGKNLKKFRWLIDMTFVSHSIIGEISTILTIEHVRNRVLHNFIMIIVGKIGIIGNCCSFKIIFLTIRRLRRA